MQAVPDLQTFSGESDTMIRRGLFVRIGLCALLVVTGVASRSIGQDSEPVMKVARQPLEANVARVVQALQLAGSPLADDELAAIKALEKSDDDAQVVAGSQTHHATLVPRIPHHSHRS